MTSPPHLLELSPSQWREWFVANGWPPFRAAQLADWVFRRWAACFDEMSDLPRSLRAALAERFRLWTTEVAACRRSDDGTQKLLLRLADAESIECVLLCEPSGRRTACVSTQVGCGMACAFCASGLHGVARNLTRGEILEQWLRLAQQLAPDERLSHLVVMGMGEPLANLDALLPALSTVTDPLCGGISARRVTISTVGLPKAILRLAEENVPYHLAVSLHAADDALRDRLVPANRGLGIEAILRAADAYFAATGRRVTYEYVMLAGVNDRPTDARRLAALLRGRCALVNLIPYNPVVGLPFKTPKADHVARFAQALQRAGIRVKRRYRRGNHIDAACGQLRRRCGDDSS